jgi:hypothetical protein
VKPILAERQFHALRKINAAASPQAVRVEGQGARRMTGRHSAVLAMVEMPVGIV